jgi:hypothetical protein
MKFSTSYHINDMQEVTDHELNRELSPDEIEYVKKHVGDYIPWFDAISLTINKMIYNRKDV